MCFNRYLASLIVFCISSAVLANPIPEDSLRYGVKEISQQPQYTEIHQSGPEAIIKWHSFNIAPDEHTHFEQPAGGVALNRIDPNQGVSQIFGHLSATGRIILVNQAGIYFGPDSHVDVGGLIASTSDMSDRNFLAGHYVFDQPSSYKNAAIVNQGHIQAADYGLIALLGTKVVNEGYVQANLGQVILASGNEMTVDLSGDQLFYFGDNRKNTPQGITHSGTIVANGGRILLTVQNAQIVLDNAINVTGVLQAQSVMQKSGEIILSADPTATVTVSGKLDVSGDKGGVIKVLGGGINLLGARLDANGDHGGGEILIGGNAHGEGFEPHAKNITIDDKTLLSADALTLGQGGKIVAWSDGYTQAYGNFSARGGLQGGDGGFVETSGNSLTIQGVQVNTAAPQGKSGLWLLDPAAVTIKNNGGTNVAMTLSNGVYSPNNGFETTTLDVSNLVSALNSSNITVITQNTGSVGAGSITVANAVLWTSGNMLTLNSTGTIAINADVSSSGGGSLVLTAPSGVSIASTLGANGTLGSLTVTGATTITGSSIQTSGNQTYNSAVTVGATTTLTGGGSSTISFANGISGANTLNLSGANQYNLSGTIANTNVNVSGGGSNNTLTVNSGNATQNWTINGSNSGSLSVGGSFNFSGIQNLSSTASTSNFTFSGGSLSSITASGTKNLSFTTPVTVQMSSATTGSVVGVLPSFSGVTNVNGSGMTLQFLGNLLYQLLFTGGGAATLNNGIAFTGIAALIGNGSTVGTFASGLSPTFTTNSFTLNGVQTTFTNVFFPGFGGGAGGFVLLSDGTLVNVPSVLSQMTTPPTSTTASNTPSATTSSNLLLSGQVQQNVNQMTQQVQTDLNQNFQQTTLTGCA